MKKIPKKYTHIIFSFYTSAIMVFIVSSILTILNNGLSNFLSHLFQAYIVAWPIAFLSLLAIKPLVSKLVNLTVEN
ncbi:DUF2798 domain-containing protein [Neisseria montereyensis]|uniref:DUF2798 domain-containing protein n=1 Tax=Neisseria montereyensis TaxID=2973938 RepID=A0ABT2FB14_9NEIS|nr:DUF2798 domain-containing protein [Neisseria montereyensis]MCS4533379.1 DUF2798 domain-containing protein [Neisseria montereyensis]